MKVAIFQQSNLRSRTVCTAFKVGLAKHDVSTKFLEMRDYSGVCSDVAIFYGLSGNGEKILNDYKSQGLNTLFIDMGYWGRLEGGRYSGYHKIAVNGVHPSIVKLDAPSDRVKKFNLAIKPQVDRPNGNVLVAGMSDKAAAIWRLRSEAWEHDIVNKLKNNNERRIVYRPKPSFNKFKRIPGTELSLKNVDIMKVLQNVKLVVTHHSNTAIEALLEGIPAYSEVGPASIYSAPLHNYSDCVPSYDERLRFISELAYRQWKITEMASGLAWDTIKRRELQ